MLLIKVLVELARGVSMMYAMTVGNDDARVSRRILPEALQTKTSIWPGVSIRMCSMGFAEGFSGFGAVRFSRREMIWSTLVANRLREVKMPPLGPRLYCFITSL